MSFVNGLLASVKPVKDVTCLIIGVVGSFITYMYGEWTKELSTLVFFIIVDYLTGVVAAGVFKNSSKSKKGSLSSAAGYKGLMGKAGIGLAVAVLHHVDLIMDTNLFMNTAVIGFIANEFISIIENLGNWGVKFPPVVTDAIELLNKKAKGDSDKESEE